MVVISPEDRLQIRAYQVMFGVDLNNAVVFFRVISVLKIRGGAVSFRRFRGGHMRGQLAVMESGQVRELTSLLEHEPPPGVRVPDFALRAPAPYSVLVTEERWSKLAVLDFNRDCGPGWKAFQLRWDIFNVPRPHDRVPIAIPGDRVSTSLARTWQDMADLIRRLEGTSFYLESPGSVELFVRFAQRMADDLDSTAAARQHIRPAFQSAALDSRRGRNGRTAAYKPPYLLQCLLLCQSIRSFLLQRKRDIEKRRK